MKKEITNMFSTQTIRMLFATLLVLGAGIGIVFAADPVGDDTFELTTSPSTGGDNTGDGGTGNADDFNYYYVGQSFTTTIQIETSGASSANIWIDYNNATSGASNLTTGSFFDTWSGQTINTSEATSFGGARVLSTGFNVGGDSSSGSGTFGTVRWSADTPTDPAYGTDSPALLDINVGVIGDTTESNISLSGVDILDDEEDFEFHIWADTVAPFAESFSPAMGATDVDVTSNFTFNLRDTRNGEGNNTGVGTGVNTSEPPGIITFNTVDETDNSSFSCSGTWGTNLCAVTVNPDPPSGISGDSRNFEYNTTYTVVVSGFEDLASTNQDALGDANGPNTMTATTTSFSTGGDNVAPEVVSESPARGSSGNATTTNVTVTIEDRDTYPSGASGTGVVSSTCKINISSPTSPVITYQEGDTNVTVSATSYGYQFIIDPTLNFAENETVTVSVFDCEDQSGSVVTNVMTTDTYTFGTIDGSTPYVDEENPADDESVAVDGTITFHIKDDGVGVDLSDTVIYVNGTYYTNGGGAGSVTTSGTRITFTDSLDFNGSNYTGDTTSLSGSSADYEFVIDPETDFTAGESVPVLIYSADTSGNLMEREVIGIVAQVDGSSFCGSGTSWNGSECTSSVVIDDDGGGGGGGGGGDDDGSASVLFAGRAHPLSRVTVSRNNSVIASTVAGPDANFSITASNLAGGDYNFEVMGEDITGLTSAPLEFDITMTDDVHTEITGLYLAPTLTTDKLAVVQGENITIFGQTVPDSTVTIGVASAVETFQQTTADDDGVFLYNFNTAVLEKGEHETRAKSEKNGEISDFGRTVAFEVGDENILADECELRGDVNGDCRVNLVDFSIVSFWYKKPLNSDLTVTEQRRFNADGIFNLADLSIMAWNWTG